MEEFWQWKFKGKIKFLSQSCEKKEKKRLIFRQYNFLIDLQTFVYRLLYIDFHSIISFNSYFCFRHYQRKSFAVEFNVKDKKQKNTEIMRAQKTSSLFPEILHISKTCGHLCAFNTNIKVQTNKQSNASFHVILSFCRCHLRRAVTLK